jgi:pyruvate dehydrogenase E2 component (dihydrolipoamide acetyltransferase)
VAGVKKDVEDFPAGEAPAPAPTPKAAPAVPSAPAIPVEAARPTMPTFTEIPGGPDVEVVEISRIRARIGQRLVESKQFVPHFYLTTEIDVAAALELRQEINAGIDNPEGKISVNDLVVKAAALTLRKFPNLNTHYYGDKLVRHKRINIGIAVSLPDGGLINVTSYDADKTSLGAMAVNHRDMITRAREGKVKPREIEGGTFSVSNLGPYDVDHFIAIINPPEAGILAIGSARKVPVVLDDGTLGVGMRMKATISVDHRVSDGAEAAEYMKLFKELLESPMRLLI